MSPNFIRYVLLAAALACTGFAWFIAAGWFGIDHGNYPAWFAAGVTFFIASWLPWERTR